MPGVAESVLYIDLESTNIELPKKCSDGTFKLKMYKDIMLYSNQSQTVRTGVTVKSNDPNLCIIPVAPRKGERLWLVENKVSKPNEEIAITLHNHTANTVRIPEGETYCRLILFKNSFNEIIWNNFPTEEILGPNQANNINNPGQQPL